jgi:putative ABC transport system substrate-binding protein
MIRKPRSVRGWALLPGVLLALAAGAPVARAGEADARVQRVGLLCWRDTDVTTVVREWARRGLLEHTSIPLEFEESVCAGDAEKAGEILARWKENGLDLLVAVGAEAARFARREAPGVPLVFASTRDPVLEGIARSWKSAGENTTGACLRLDMRETLGLFARVVPGLKRLGVLVPPAGEKSAPEIRKAEIVEEAAREGKTRFPALVKERVEAPGGAAEWVAALGRLAAKGVEAVWVPDEPDLDTRLPALSREANRAKLPLLATHPQGIRRYTVVGISPDSRRLGIRVAALCARILRDGADPARIPVASLGAFHVIMNLKAAERAGLRIPLETLTRADVIVDRDGW